MDKKRRRRRVLFSTLAQGALGNAPGYEYKTFDQGSASSIDASNPASVRITPVFHWDSKWLWFCMRNNGLARQTPHYLVAKADRAYSEPVANEWLAVWSTSPDTDTWNQFDTITIGASDIEFYNSSAFAGGTIYIASLPMYPLSRIQRRITELDAADVRVTSPTSATNFIIGYTTSRGADDGSGRTVPALPLYALKITNPSGHTKNNCIITAQQHASETMSAYALEGAIDWLLAGSEEAEFLLDWFDFYIYPSTNIQGIFVGYYGSQPQDKTQNHNALWDTTGTLECIDAFKTAMATDTGGTLEIGIDLHGATSTETIYGYTHDNTEALHVAYTAKLAALDAAFDLRTLTTYYPHLLADYWYDNSARMYFTIEIGSSTTRTLANWKTSGENIVKAMSSFLADGQFTNGPGVGSRDFNGTTDRIDWDSPWTVSGTTSISLWVYLDRVNTYQLIWHVLSSAAGQSSCYISNPGNAESGRLGFFFNVSSGATLWRQGNSILTAGEWIHLLVTWDGTTTATGIHIYKNGTEITYWSTQNGGTLRTASGVWSLGAWDVNDSYNTNGKIAQVGAWNRVLTSTEIADLAAGYAPDLAASSGLQFYFKGNTSSLVAAPGGTGTADGTTSLTGVGTGPSITYTTYKRKVKAIQSASLIGYLPMGEASGTTAGDESTQGNDGTYANVTLAQTGIGDGLTSALFIPASASVLNLGSSGLPADFSGAAGTIVIWTKASGAGVWTDGVQRNIFYIGVNANNIARILKQSTDNTITWQYLAGGTNKTVSSTAYNVTTWQMLALTWDKAADAAKAYVGGTQVGSTMTGLGTWAGTPAIASIGAYYATPALTVYDGYLAHAAVWSVALTAAELTVLATIIT